MAFCRPTDWVRRTDRLPGLIDGFTSADGQYGAYVARYGVPGSLRELPRSERADRGPDGRPRSQTGSRRTPTYDDGSGTTDDYFMGLSRHRPGAGTTTAPATSRVGAGMTADGAVLVGMVYGPYDWFDGNEPYRILNSMITLE